jgi:hypothetical protein
MPQPQSKAPDFIPDEPDFIPDNQPSYDTSQIPTSAADDAWKAAVHSTVLGVPPGYAYQNRDEIDKQMRERDPDYDNPELDPTIANDIKVGLESSIFGLKSREELPEEIRNPGMIDKFVQGLSQTVADLPVMIGGGIVGGAIGAAAGSEAPIVGNITVGALGASAGAFALPAAMREALIEGIRNGDVKDFPDLLRRSAKVVLAGAKGAAVGTATELAGGIPVGSFIAKSDLATAGVRSIYQAAALTTAADLTEGKLPTASDFSGNAALIVPLNLITRGFEMTKGDAQDALMEVYKKDGRTPEESLNLLNAQPPVKEGLPPGLRPAIKVGDGVLEGDEGETHSQLSDRLGEKPVSMEELERDPSLAPKVLSTPEIHEQDVIDAAWVMWDDALRNAHDPRLIPEANVGIEEQRLEASRGNLKSGRGFVAPESGKFLTREQARAWMKKNEPDVHESWLDSQHGDKNAELHAADYAAARQRVAGRNLAEGEPDYNGMSNDLAAFLADSRSGVLNKIKAGLKSSGYGKEAIRTLLVGPKAMLRTQARQLVDRLQKLVPDEVDQEALHFARDYRNDPDALRKDIGEIEAGSNARLKEHLPAMRRALEPMTPGMQQADQLMTDYFQKALDLGRQVGTLDSNIDPSRYSPRLLMRAMDQSTGKGIGSPRFSEKNVHAIRREYLNALDPLKEGDTVARTFNAFDELSIYGDRHASSVAVQLFKTELKNSALGIEGSKENHPDGWVELNPTSARNFYVPKEIANALDPLFRTGDSAIAKFLHIQSVIKGIELTLSVFHMKAMTITALNNLGLTDFERALASDNDSSDFETIEQRGSLYGLTTTKTSAPIEAYRGLKPEQEGRLSFLTDNVVTRSADTVFKGITKATFDVIQRKFKVMDFARKEAGWIAKHPNATLNEYAEAMRGYSKEINAAYGGLNWDIMGVSRSMQNISRLFLLAPDWTFSNVANLKYALTDRGTAGAGSRAFFARSFATGFAMTAAASIYVGGKYDPTDIRHIDQVYLGTDQDGKEMYGNWFFAGAPKDAMGLVKNVAADGPAGGLARFIVNKAGPIAQTIYGLASNKDFTGKPIYKADDSLPQKTLEEGEYVAGRLIPFSGVSAIETVKNALTDPEHEYSYRDILELLADALGSQTIHYGDGETDRPAKKEKSILPGRKSVTSKRKMY